MRKAWNGSSEPLLLYSPRKAMVRGATAGVAEVAASNRATFGMRGSSGMGYVELVGVLRLRPARTPDFAQNDEYWLVERNREGPEQEFRAFAVVFTA